MFSSPANVSSLAIYNKEMNQKQAFTWKTTDKDTVGSFLHPNFAA